MGGVEGLYVVWPLCFLPQVALLVLLVTGLGISWHMQTKIEGLLLRKVTYRDNDLITTLLLRSGRKISVLFYGGRSGGSRNRSSILEVGFMLAVELQPRRNSPEQELYTAKEWNLIWSYERIRYHYHSFCLMSSCLELIETLSLPADLYHYDDKDNKEEQKGLFVCISNTLFYLEKELREKKLVAIKTYWGFFLAKVIQTQGLFPLIQHCLFCEHPFHLDENPPFQFHLVEGGFSCPICSSGVKDKEVRPVGVEEAWAFLSLSQKVRYVEMQWATPLGSGATALLLDYFCTQNHLNKQKLKTIQHLSYGL